MSSTRNFYSTMSSFQSQIYTTDQENSRRQIGTTEQLAMTRLSKCGVAERVDPLQLELDEKYLARLYGRTRAIYLIEKL